MPIFDRYITIDWSAASARKTGTDSIWIGHCVAAAGVTELLNPPSRHVALSQLLTRAGWAVENGQRALIALDFPLGYPAGFADRAGLADASPRWRRPWRYLSSQIEDEANNANNRFAVAAILNERIGAQHGPFWGCPPAKAGPHLDMRRPRDWPVAGLAEFRRTEVAARHRLGLRPQPVWKLAYAGSVGSQALTGIPVLERFAADPAIAPHVLVWPFETAALDFTALPRPLLVLAELYPSLFDDRIAEHRIRDARQMVASCAAMARWDRDGRLAGHLRLSLAPEADRALAIAEEGWILGV